MDDKEVLKTKVMLGDDIDELLMGAMRGMAVEGYCAELTGEFLASVYHIARITTFEPTYDKDE